MSNNEPKTLRELWLWLKPVLENMQNEIIDIKKNPDNYGKWIVRFAILGTLILQAIILYKGV